VRAEDEDVGTFVVAAFEEGAEDATVFAGGSSIERVQGKHPKGERSVSWKLTSEEAMLSFSRVPADLREYRTLRLRARAVKSPKEPVWVRFVSASGASLAGYLPAFPEKWGVVELPLPYLKAAEKFEPDQVGWLQFFGGDPDGLTLDIDDVELVTGGAGWRYSREERAARGRDPEAHRWAIANFEQEADLLDVRSFRSSFTRESVSRRRKSRFAGRWTVEEDERSVWLDFGGVPSDVSEYRTLRFRARAPKAIADEVRIRLSSEKGYLSAGPTRRRRGRSSRARWSRRSSSS
jgi:hypothetical protein